MAAPPDNDVLWARGLHYAYDDGSPALRGVSLGVREGEILAVTGARGCGKTTLLRCLSGQTLPASGEVWFNSVPVHTLNLDVRERLRRDRFGWIDSTPQLVPELTVWENAALPLLLRGSPHRIARRTAHEWLERLDVGGCARRRPAELAQAQRQRVAVARALVHAPAVLFADEPTAPLHEPHRAQVLRTLGAAARSHGITVVLATHDSPPDGAGTALADRTLALADGRPARSRPAASREAPGDGGADTGGAEGPGDSGGSRGSGSPGRPEDPEGPDGPAGPGESRRGSGDADGSGDPEGAGNPEGAGGARGSRREEGTEADPAADPAAAHSGRGRSAGEAKGRTACSLSA
ncbi:ATP-binding cassette domain-containing protein [Streptomyces sp. SB3404]|uniref:ATP-binding cassette domain-containing protein n=1 Tax=Streptomyces boncukensis TaxID=2711219 RepID=A0A6G4WSF8_9ACTN|nr:ATP-binding cassette domain-containing protein [Streptomyces boncukensis]